MNHFLYLSYRAYVCIFHVCVYSFLFLFKSYMYAMLPDICFNFFLPYHPSCTQMNNDTIYFLLNRTRTRYATHHAETVKSTTIHAGPDPYLFPSSLITLLIIILFPIILRRDKYSIVFIPEYHYLYPPYM